MTLPLLLESEELFNALESGIKGDLLIVDLCNPQIFQKGHLPDAVHVSPQQLVGGAPPAPGKIAPLDSLEVLFNYLGLKEDTHVVVYDDEGGGWAGRFIWTLDAIGHSHYSYLNGGIRAWHDAGLPLSQTTTRREPVVRALTLNRDVVVEAEDIIGWLEKENFVVWDARTPEEYRGDKVLAERGGHIPGAINCEWTSMMDPNRALRIREDAQIKLRELGFDRNQLIVTHCQSHHRSGFTYLLGKILGFNIRGYHGSWSEWGNRPDTPVER